MPNPPTEKVQVRCPVCKNIFVLEATSDKEYIRCSYCGNSLKLPRYLSKTTPKPATSLPHFRQVSSSEIQLESINIRNTRPLIQTIVFKDIHGSLKLLMMLFIIGIIITMILSPIASTAPDHDSYLEEIEEETEPSERADEIKAEETRSINTQFGIAIFFTALIFLVVAQTLYGGEVRKGTIRSIALYPIDMNGITIAKIISISIISGLILFAIFFLPILPFYFSNTFPNFPAIIIMAYIISVILLIFTAFTSHLPTYLFKNIKFSLNRLIIIFTIFAIIFTETVLNFIGQFYVITSRMSGTDADKFLEAWSETAQGLAVLSPYHGWGRILTSMFGFNTGGFDFFLIGPIGVLLIVGGFMMGKKIYLDVFHLD